MKFQPTKDSVKLLGRSLYRDNIRYLGYSASSIAFRFIGKTASVTFVSDPEDFIPEFHAQVAIYRNEEKEPLARIELTRQEETIDIYSSDVEEEVTLRIIKLSEPEYAICGIKEIIIDTDKLLEPPAPKKRRMQLIGDSITCGFGIEGSEQDMIHDTHTENPMKAYSGLTAEALDTDYEIVAWNGKGVITSYIGEGEDSTDVPDPSWLVSMLYEYTDAGCEKQYFHNAPDDWEFWDHSSFEPDLITVFLGTNDASYTREIPERDMVFTEAYISFLERIHGLHPNAKILCMLGTMDERLCPAVEKAVDGFKEAHDDVSIHYLALPHQLDEDGLGTFWHPSPTTHKKTAEVVIAKAKEIMGW